jgi:hypothetical protein
MLSYLYGPSSATFRARLEIMLSLHVKPTTVPKSEWDERLKWWSCVGHASGNGRAWAAGWGRRKGMVGVDWPPPFRLSDSLLCHSQSHLLFTAKHEEQCTPPSERHRQKAFSYSTQRLLLSHTPSHIEGDLLCSQDKITFLFKIYTGKRILGILISSWDLNFKLYKDEV